MSNRVDQQTGAAHAGSQRQTQRWVNDKSEVLTEALKEEFPELAGAEVRWTSPLASDGYREYQDRAFLKSVGLDEDHADALAEYWPRGGPVWDALAVVEFPPSEDGGVARPGVILAEGKSYPGELRSAGCQAGPDSREKIEAALAQTQHLLGVQGQTPAAWCGPLYQSANRLAHLTWLRSRGVRAWLVHLLFIDDPRTPTSADEWSAAVADASTELGLPEHIDHVGHLLLPAD